MESEEFLDKLIDNLIKNQLKSVDISMVASGRPDRFLERLKKICHEYKTKLDNNYQPADILKKIVEEANYARLIQKGQNLVVSKTMELLQESFQYIKEMNGKDLIFFIGNTGAGKSTAISYFLGAQMVVFGNNVGDRLVQIDKNNTENNIKCPAIGESLGESKTLYTQGYFLKNSTTTMLVDSAGLNDTRGSEYELCANLSMDHAVQAARKILSVVVVIPQWLNKYMNVDTNSRRLKYVPAMEGRFMQRKFGQCIEMSTYTWTHHIFKEYLEVLPEVIRTSENTINEKRQRKIHLKSQEDDKQASLEQLQENQKKSKEIINECERPESHPTNLIPDLEKKLQEQISQAKDEKLTQLEKDLNEIERQINERIGSLENVDKAISNFSNEIKKKREEKEELSEEIKQLETGSTEEPLWEYRPRAPDDILRHLAIVIHTQIKIAEQLRDFSRSVMDLISSRNDSLRLLSIRRASQMESNLDRIKTIPSRSIINLERQKKAPEKEEERVKWQERRKNKEKNKKQLSDFPKFTIQVEEQRVDEQRVDEQDQIKERKQDEIIMMLACQNFITIYDENIKKLMEECRKDLTFT